MERRSRNEVMLDILKCLADGPLRKTHVMNKCNLSWQTTSEFLDILVERQLVSFAYAPKRQYSVTDKGRNAIEEVAKFREHFE